MNLTSVFDLTLDTEEGEVSEVKKSERLASIDTVATLATILADRAVIVKDEKTKKETVRIMPPISDAGMFYFAGVSARGYGQVGFPLTEALAFATALDTIASGGAVAPEPITLASLTGGRTRRTMAQNLLNATPYVGADDTVIGIKVSGSNWEGSSKPKGTLISVSELGTVAWFVAYWAFVHMDTPEADKVGLATIAKKYEDKQGVIGAALKPMLAKKVKK